MVIIKTITGKLSSGKTSPCPEIECYIPKENLKGIGIIILPGGGYHHLAAHEGKGYAEYFSKAGMACFVVTYRLGSHGYHHPAMLEDALAALNTVRSGATDWGIRSSALGIMGSSAGGHLAAHTLVAWDQYQSDVSLRPDFGILCYPVITSRGPYASKASIRNLTGDRPTDALLDELSIELHVTHNTPPCFIWHTGTDASVPVENSLLFATALRHHNIPFEYHIYHKGRHGLGLGTTFDWASECVRWLKDTVSVDES